MVHKTDRIKRKPYPKTEAGFLSLLTFSYLYTIIKKSIKKDFVEEDLYEITDYCESKKCGIELERISKFQEKRYGRTSLGWIFWSNFGYTFTAITFVSLVTRTLQSAFTPNLTTDFISYFKENQTNITKEEVIYTSIKAYATSFLFFFITRHFQVKLVEFSIKVGAAISSLIFQKTFRLSSKALEEVNIGNIVTLITKDVLIFERSLFNIVDLIVCSFQVTVVCVLLYNKIGTVAFSGIGFLIFVCTIQVVLGRYISKLRVKIDNDTAERIKLTKETLSSIKTIKIFNWQNYFIQNISNIRRMEVQKMVKDSYAKSILVIIGSLTSDGVVFILMLSYIWIGESVNVETVFYIINCLQTVLLTIGYILPWNIGLVSDLCGSVVRINKFLQAEESSFKSNNYSENPKVLLKNVSVSMNDKDILKNVSMHLKNGLHIVTGKTGSGKSTLLRTILEEYPYKGYVITSGRISYASQNPWLFPGSIKENIIFGETYDEKRFNRVINACALKYDLDILEDGENTIISDKGSNLSNGQQSRINLARAIYRDSEIYLLDDCLSNLDSKVQKHIFKDCIQHFLKNKLCILVSQNKDNAIACDSMLELDDAKISYIRNLNKFSSIEKEPSNDETNITYKNLNIDGEFKETDNLILAESSKNVYYEINKTGNVKIDTYHQYIKFGRGYILLIFMLFLFAISQFSESSSTKMLAKWTDLEEKKLLSANNSSAFKYTSEKANSTLISYGIFLFASVLTYAIKLYSFYDFTKTASIRIHEKMTKKIINSTLKFFDTHLIGNVINRFSQDMNNIDEFIPVFSLFVIRTVCSFVGMSIVTFIINWMLFLPIGLLLIIVVVLRIIYVPMARSFKRLESSTRSPLVGHVNAAFEGLETIKSFRLQQQEIEKFYEHNNLFLSAHYGTQIPKFGIFFIVDFFCVTFNIAVMWVFIFLFPETSASNVGLALMQISLSSFLINFCFSCWMEVETYMTSVERSVEYTKAEQENKDGKILENWPPNGAIQFENVCLSYNNNATVQLSNINFIIKPKEKIGVIGRTGSGKSSLISLLLRLYKYTGKIFIDDVDITSLNIKYLRDNISVIPQDPVLFSGTFRNNIDPLNIYQDEEIWTVISKINIKHIVSDLYINIDEAISKLSVGEKQLICLARIMMKKTKILIMDEATANIDPGTELELLSLIKEHFYDCTVIHIAHKINCIIDYDKIMVLNKGVIVEYGNVQNLLNDENSCLSQLYK